MSKGLNTETSRRLLGPGQHPQFKNVTLAGGKYSPRKSHSAYTLGNSGAYINGGETTNLENWLAHSIAQSPVYQNQRVSVENVAYGLNVQAHIFCTADGGSEIKMQVHDNDHDVSYSLFEDISSGTLTCNALPYDEGGFVITGRPTTGITVGETRTYFARKRMVDVGGIEGKGLEGTFSNVITIDATTNIKSVSVQLNPGASIPEFGQILEDTSSGDWGTILGVYTQPLAGNYTVYIGNFTGSTIDTACFWYWDGLSSSGTGVPSSYTDFTGYLIPSFTFSSQEWSLYGLSSIDSAYYLIGDTTSGSQIDDTNLKLDMSALPLYSGPLDANGFPSTLVTVGLSYASDKGCTALTLFKDCMLYALGQRVWISSPGQYATVTEFSYIDFPGNVQKMIARAEFVEVYTTAGLFFIIGSPPVFEFRNTAITQPVVSADTIIRTDVGTFALYREGLCLVQANGSDAQLKNLTKGVNTPWLDQVASLSSCIAGEDNGVYILVDATGRGLCYDWRQDEFYETEFSNQPRGFYYSTLYQTAVYYLSGGATYHKYEEGDSDVTWAVEFRKVGDGASRKLPSYVWIDIDGDCVAKTYVEDTQVGKAAIIDRPMRLRLPLYRGQYHSILLSGTSAWSEASILEVRHGGQ